MFVALASLMSIPAVAVLAGPSLNSVVVVEKYNYRELHREFTMGDQLFRYGNELDAEHPSVNITNEEDCRVAYRLDRKRKFLVAYVGVRDRQQLSANAAYNNFTVVLDGKVVVSKRLYGPQVHRMVIDVTNVKLMTFRATHFATVAESRFVNEPPAVEAGDWTNVSSNSL